MPRYLTIVVWCALFSFWSFEWACADEVKATLSRDRTTVGQPVELQIVCDFDVQYRPRVPDQIEADGLRITYRGQSTQMQVINFKASLSRIFSYAVEPQEPGEWTIPAIKVEVGGRAFETKPLALKVTEREEPEHDSEWPEGVESGMIFGEVVLSKEEAYVGEVVDAEIRYYFDARLHARPFEPPILQSGDFFTYRLGDVRSGSQHIDGRLYRVYSFETALSGMRPGELTFGPVPMRTTIQVPRRVENRRLDPFRNDPFGDDFFAQFFSGGRTEQISAESDEAVLHVKPLPEEGKPEDFSGAVGRFQMEVARDRNEMKTGEPATITAVVEGIGSFNRMQNLGVFDETGWRAYPPTGRFERADEMGVRGTKTFEYVFIPEEPVDALPRLSLSFFDPDEENYVTLVSPELPVLVEPGPGYLEPEPPALAVQPVEVETDEYLLPIMEEPGATRRFDTWWSRRGFWLAQSMPALAALLLLATLLWQRSLAKPMSRAARLAMEKRKLQAGLDDSSVSTAVAFKKTVEFLGLLVSGQRTDAIRHTGELMNAMSEHPALQKRLGSLIEAFEAAAYGGRRDAPLSDQERRELKEVVETCYEIHAPKN